MSGAEELCWTPATELARMVREREVSPSEIAAAQIARIERVNPALNAIVEYDAEAIRERARRLTDEVTAGGELGPLHGVPFTLKEACRVEGTVETLGLVPLKDARSTETETFARRMFAAGGLFLGKTNMSEAGYCGSSTNHVYGPTHNAWKQGVSAGGSSAGAAAGVASGLGQLAEGSDGAGSVRIPAALNGVVGLKPGLGRIPHTIVPSRFETFLGYGTIARTVADAALMLDVLAHPDPSDPLSLPEDGSRFLAAAGEGLGKLRVAWSPNLGFEPEVDPEIVAVCERAVGAFEELGCEVVEAAPDWENPEEAMWEGIWKPAYATMVDLFDWDALAGQVDEQLVQVIREGAAAGALDVGLALEARGRMWDRFAAFMGEYDLLVSPTLSRGAFPADAYCPPALDGEPLRRQALGWLLTYPTNMLGTPAISVPAGFEAAGVPVGLQIAGGLHAEALVIRAAAAFEAARPWADRRPAEFETSDTAEVEG
ncbi:MAG TPA: amidase family protein [Solirubrobacterales bacterium]|nr:amidase family protein [Solirubrobacterales bacterium]